MSYDILSEYDDWVQEHMSILKSNEIRENTLLSYQNSFEKFRDFLTIQDIKSLSSLRVIHISRYIEYLKANYAISSVNTHYNILKTLFRYITENIEYEKDYIKLFSTIKIRVNNNLHEDKFLSKESIKRIEEYLKSLDKSSIKSAQMSLIFKFGYYFGLRISETIAIKSSDIKDDEKDSTRYKITTKNIKKRDHSKKYFFIKKEIIDQELSTLSEHEYIFFSSKLKDKHITRRAGHQIMKRLYRYAHVDSSGTHILRHTCAKSLVDKNIHLATIQAHLGHSNIQTTMIYAKSDDDSKRAAVDAIIAK
jgi:site-specific recombinase XerD